VNATTPDIVLDASAAVRGLLRPEGSATELVDRLASGVMSAFVPDLFVSEVTNALAVRVSARRWPLATAAQALDVVLAWPLVVQQCEPLAQQALDSATTLGLSAYEAFYAVLSQTLGLSLVTADRRLAETVPSAVLVA
jgi:predicted nucleic acid-binding protein